MKADFWYEKWESQQIGFHQRDGNPLLVAHFAALGLGHGARVFVPLCGKTRDIAWLMGQGCRVVAVELSEIAVQQLFAEMDVTPLVTVVGDLTLYAADGLDVYVGDIFAVTAEILGPVDAVFDRAALVALPDAMRSDYADHLIAITGTTPQLVITFVYDQALMDGPPFSISEQEINARYATTYAMKRLETSDLQGGFKGQVPAVETVWLLRGRSV
jgi:thiopurine S-methyltransferase